MKHSDDLKHINNIRGGDTGSFIHIVRKYQGKIFNMVSKMMQDRYEAEDVVQEIFIKVYQSLHKFEGKSEFSTWLYRVAYNITISELRKKKTFIIYKDDINNADEKYIEELSDAVEKEELLQYLDKVLKKMSPEDSLLITLYYTEDLSVNTIAEITGLTPSNVKVKLFRIRKHIHSKINKIAHETYRKKG